MRPEYAYVFHARIAECDMYEWIAKNVKVYFDICDAFLKAFLFCKTVLSQSSWVFDVIHLIFFIQKLHI